MKEFVMEIYKKHSKLTPTCVKENIERKEKLEKQFQIEKEILNSKLNAQEEENTSQDENVEPTPIQNDTQLSDQIFAASGPYPNLTNISPNRKDVKLLKSLAFGNESELSAILTYIYQNVVLNPELGIMKEILEQIAIVEMHHYDLLSNAIVAFGGDPTLTDGNGNVWTGRNILTIINPKQMLLKDIAREQDAIRAYTRAARETNNLSLAQLFLRIIEDERIHIDLLEKMLSKLY